jgi:hypothetical protein
MKDRYIFTEGVHEKLLLIILVVIIKGLFPQRQVSSAAQ